MERLDLVFKWFVASGAAAAAVGSTGKETVLGGIIAAIGLAVTNFLGGWDQGLQILITVMIADYVSGVH